MSKLEIRDFISENFSHFNAGELARCVVSLREFLDGGGRLMITLAGAMSTAEIGKSLAPAIRKQRIHAICCTGANLEEDLFGLIARSQYERVENWRQQSSEEDAELAKRGLNRGTDVAIPETVIETVGGKILELWEEAEAVGGDTIMDYSFDMEQTSVLLFIYSRVKWKATGMAVKLSDSLRK